MVNWYAHPFMKITQWFAILSQELVFLIDPTFLNFWISIVPLNIEISLLIEMWELGSNRRKKKKNAKKQQEILHIFITFYVRFCYLCLNNKVSLLKYGSEERGSSLYKCSPLLGFIMSKKLRGLWFYLLIKVQNATSLVFLT